MVSVQGRKSNFLESWTTITAITTSYNRIEDSTRYVTSAIDSERGYLELSLLYMERRFNIYSSCIKRKGGLW